MRKKASYNVRHFRIMNGEKVEFNPFENKELADKCKFAFAFVVTGKEHVLVEKK